VNEVIRLRDMEKRREKAGSKFRLSVPEFSVGAGDFVAVVGESGCGKSTLMDMLALVLRPSAASTFELRDAGGAMQDVTGLWAAQDQRRLATLRKELLGYVLQAGGLFPYLSVAENALLPRRLKGLGASREALRELAYGIGLAAGEPASGKGPGRLDGLDFSLLEKKPRHLSGGQRQRAAILRSLLSEPTVVLADEPTAAVDGLTAESIMTQFRRIARDSGVSIVMVTHDRALARGHVDRAYVFERPRLDADTGFVDSTLAETDVAAL